MVVPLTVQVASTVVYYCPIGKFCRLNGNVYEEPPVSVPVNKVELALGPKAVTANVPLTPLGIRFTTT